MTAPTLTFAGRSGVPVDLARLVSSRMLIQANSGGGKSWALRYLLEQTHGKIPHLVLDSEGEFPTLRERFDYVLAGGGGDVAAKPKAAKLLCRRLVELGASAVIDLYDLKLPERRQFVRLFLDELMHLPRKLWRPTLIVIDEAHRLCPERGSGDAESTDAVITLCTQGRKRGYAAVLATQRLSKLHKDAAAELLNVLIGRTGLDVDAKRAGDILGFEKAQRNTLRDLEPGSWYAFGPAIAREVTLVRTGDVQTTHPEPGKIGNVAPPAPAAVQKLLAQMQDLEAEAAEEERTVQDLQRRARQLEGELRKARKASPAPDPELVQRQVDRAVKQAVVLAEKPLAARMGRLEAVIGRARGATEKIATAAEQLLQVLEVPAPNGSAAAAPGRSAPGPKVRPAKPGMFPKTPSRQAPATIPREIPPGSEELTRPQRKILDAVATFEALGLEEADRTATAAIAGYKPGSGHVNNVMGSLATAGLIGYPRQGYLSLTDAGRAEARALDIDTLEDVHAAWFGICNGPQRKLLEVLVARWPEEVGRDELAEASGYTAGTGHFNNVVGGLHTMGAVEYPRQGYVKASDLLFPEAVR